MNQNQSENVLRWLVRNGGSALVNYRLYAPSGFRSRPAFRTGEEVEEIGDGSPFRSQAVDSAWEYCQRFQRAVQASDNPNMVSATRIRAESGVSVDANPYFGLTRAKLEAVIRAAYTSTQMPEILLALWAKEGSHRMATAPRLIPQATTAQNAKTIFRCQVYYEDLGADHFIVTTRIPGRDNVWDDSDAAARGHETHFGARVRELVASRDLSEDVSAAINRDLTTSSASPFSVTPSVKFYSLSLLLVDALFSRMQRGSFSQINQLSPEMNYLQWNMGTSRYQEFLVSADRHRREPTFLSNGQPISLERWALHTIPKQTEWHQPRINAIRFMHAMESYRPIFQPVLNLIKPGIEELRVPGHAG